MGFVPEARFHPASPRSGRQHKAWGVSPRIKDKNGIKPAERATASIRMIQLPPAPRAWFNFDNEPGADAPGFMLTSAPRTKTED